MARHLTLGLALSLAAGCVDEGSVTLRFDVPEAEALRPAGAETLTLVARVGEDAPRATTAQIGDGSSIDLGQLPIEDEVWLAAEMRTAQERLVGYGQAAGPLAIEAGADVEATIPVRRPFVYLAGAGARLVSLDASVPASAAYQGMLAAPGTPEVIADVAGTELATITGAGALSYVDTSTHAASTRAAVPLPAAPLDAVATPDGAFLVVGHGGAAPQVSVVDVATGGVEAAVLDAPAERVAVTRGSDGAWWGVALLGRATTDTQCAPSRLAAFPLATPANETAAVIATSIGISDLGGDARTGLVLVADRCGDRVLRFDPVAGALDTTTPVMTLPAPTAVAATDGRAWAVGHDRMETDSSQVPDGVIDAWLVLGSATIGGDGAGVDALPPVVERVRATEVDYPDQAITQDLHANTVVASDLVILPGGEQLGLRVAVELHGDEFQNIFGDIVIPELDMTTEEYWLVEASTRVPSQRVRTECALVVGPCSSVCILREWDCNPDLDAPQVGEFTATGMVALFGAR